MAKRPDVKRNLLIHFLVLALVGLTLPGIVFSAPPEKSAPAKISPILTPGTSQKLNITKPQSQIPKPKPVGKILDPVLDTESNGDWSYLYQIRNTGLVALNMREARLKAFQTLADNREILIHEVNYESVLGPGGVATGREPVHRCFEARKLRLEWWYQGVRLDSKTLQVPAIKAEIVKTRINKKDNTWYAEIKNRTSLALRVSAQPFAKGGMTPKTGQSIGTEAQQVIPANGQAKFMGSLAAFDGKGSAEVRAWYKNPNLCGGPAETLLDTMLIGDDGAGVPDVFIENLTWDRPAKSWTVRVKNQRTSPVQVMVCTWPIENGTPGMTMHSLLGIGPKDSALAAGTFWNYNVPPGTRLQVRVLLKPSDELMDSKILIMD